MPPVSKKVILIGNFGVGKTSLIARFVHQRFSDSYLTTLGVKIDKKQLTIQSTELTLLIWDIAGEVNQAKVPKSYYLGSHGVIYVYDLSRPSTYESIEGDIAYVRSMIPNAPIIITGNKRDLVTDEDLAAHIAKMPVKTDFFTSAKMGEQVELMFETIGAKLLT